jgi:hypothetical protein
MTKKDDTAAELGKAYAFEGAALELGALVLEGEAHPEARIRMPLSMLNRHGLVAGATGTGKTKTLQLIAEQLSDAGVPVFLADIKGDVSGMAAPGQESDRITQRAKDTATEWAARGFPTEFLNLGGQGGTGVPVRATMTSFGPLLLSKVLGLNETQESSLGLVFHFADKSGLPLLDLKDLRAVISHLTSDEGKDDLKELGGLSAATAGVILREPHRSRGQRWRRLLRRARVRHPRPHAHDARRQGPAVHHGAAGPPGQAAAVLDVPYVAARRPVP